MSWRRAWRSFSAASTRPAALPRPVTISPARANRFWTILHRAGFTPRQLRAEEERSLLQFGCGITAAGIAPNAARIGFDARRTHRSGRSFADEIRRLAPNHLAFLGKAAYAAVLGRSEIAWGLQESRFGGATVWLLPNPSGLNRGFSLDQLVRAYAQLRHAMAQDLPSVRSP